MHGNSVQSTSNELLINSNLIKQKPAKQQLHFKMHDSVCIHDCTLIRELCQLRSSGLQITIRSAIFNILTLMQMFHICLLV